jgi:hypothetical protein
MSGDKKSIAASVADLGDGVSFVVIPSRASIKGHKIKNGELVPADPCLKLAEKKVRMERNARLEREVDPVLNNTLRRRKMGAEKVREGREYRDALLDITKGDVFAPKWPKKPKT